VQCEADRIVNELAELEQQLRGASSATRIFASVPAIGNDDEAPQLPCTASDSQLAAWGQLVRECALASGRKESNLKVYLGNATLNRQLVALGPAAVADILQLTAQATARASDLSVTDRGRMGALLQAARGQLDKKDSGSLAALSAVDRIYGRRATLVSAAACPAASVAIKREATDCTRASSINERSGDAEQQPEGGARAGKRRHTALMPTCASGDDRDTQ
jgi:hypothetical protein